MDSALHLLVPFALPSAGASGALHGLEGGALQKLLARARALERVIGDDFQACLPHQRWLARCFGLRDASDGATGSTPGNAAPLAPYMMLADGADPGDERWACVEPVHIRIAPDHLILFDPDALQLAPHEALELLDAARDSISQLGVRLVAPTPLRWYVAGDALGALAGAAPLRAAGRNIEIWLARDADSGARSRAWMQLQNEVQMIWFEHPINQARERRGLPTANSIWLHAQGRLQPVGRPYSCVYSNAVATRGLALAARCEMVAARPACYSELTANGAASPRSTLVELGSLAHPFVAQDWTAWQDALRALEHDWFEPLLPALQGGALGELALTLCGDTSVISLGVTRGDLRKFWRRRTFDSLLVA